VERQRPGQRDPEDVARAKAAKERARIDEYTGLRAQLASHKAGGDYSPESLALTTRILEKNPEYPSGWAYRRRILQRTLAELPDEQAGQSLLEEDLDLTSQCLRRNPKEYSVWNHRKWLLRTMPDPDWRFELKTVEALLEKDARNYHGWDYRRYTVASILAYTPPSYSTRKQANPTIASELAYTTTKISASFSNFSAWHYRSKLLAKMWAEEGLQPTDARRRKQVDEEFELIKQALYTDPEDQSAWIYHRWLVGEGSEELVQREIAVIEELTELEPESKWCLESLVYYTTLLLRLDPDRDTQQANELRQKSLERLEVLQRVDPLRRKRYADLKDALSQPAQY